MRRPNASQIKAYRDQHQVSIFEARQTLTRRAMAEAVNEAKTLEDLKPVLLQLISASK